MVTRESHNMTGTRLYNIWANMRQRCNNPRATSYDVYGKKGVQVCKEWDNSFTSFMHWAQSNGYENHLTIDRIETDKGYNPDNCRWITKAENSRRASETNLAFVQAKGAKAKEYEYRNKTQSLQEWAKELDSDYHALYSRIVQRGWSVERALTTPIKKYKGRVTE